MNKKIEISKKQIKRILISLNDILEATNYAHQLLKHKYCKPDYLSRLDDPNEDFTNSDEYENMNALTTALIVSYSRPFTQNEGQGSAIPSLPRKIMKIYNDLENELHYKILGLRNKAVAHSDADLFDAHLSRSEFDGSLVPTYIDYPLEYFNQDKLVLFQKMVEKLMSAFEGYIKSIFEHHGESELKNLVK